jgi:hypothetical protein
VGFLPIQVNLKTNLKYLLVKVMMKTSINHLSGQKEHMLKEALSEHHHRHVVNQTFYSKLFLIICFLVLLTVLFTSQIGLPITLMF